MREPGDGGVRFATKEFTITRGGRETFHAYLEPVRVKPSPTTPAIEQPKQVPSPATPSGPRGFTEIRQLLGHKGINRVNAVAMSPDNRLAASADHSGRIIVYDLPSGEERFKGGSPGAHVSDLAFTADGKALFYCGRARPRLWTFAAERSERELPMPQIVTDSVAITPDGRRGLIHFGYQLVLWDLDGVKPLGRFPGLGDALNKATNKVAVSADGRKVLYNATDNTVRVGELDPDRNPARITGSAPLAFCGNDRILFTQNVDGPNQVVVVWDLRTGKEVRRLHHLAPLNGLSCTPDGKHCLTVSDKEVYLWDVETGRWLGSVGAPAAPFRCAALSPDGRLALTGGEDQIVRLWRIEPTSTARPIEPGPAAQANPDRRAAQRLVQLGNLRLRVRNQVRQILKGNPLPVEDFRLLEAFDLDGSLQDSDLELLRNLPDVRAFKTDGPSKITDAGLVPLATLTALESLWLANTLLTNGGLKHLQGMMKLQELSIGGTQVADAGLVYLQGLTSLEKLDIGRTKVTDAGLVHLHGLTNLRALQIYDNPITNAGLNECKGLVHLTELNLMNTKVTLEGQESLAGFKELRKLWLVRTPVTDTGLKVLAPLTQLTHLGLDGTKVSDAGLNHLEKLQELLFLNLAGTSITDAGLAHLHGMKRLEQLHLTNTKVTKAGVEKLRALLPRCEISSDHGTFKPETALEWLFRKTEVKNVKELTELRDFGLEDNELTDAIFCQLQLPHVVDLGVHSTQLTDLSLAHLATMPKLRRFNFGMTKATGKNLDRLRNLDLELLILHDTPAGDEMMAHLPLFPHLFHLELHHTRITDKGLPNVAQLKELRFLALADTAVTDAGLVHLRDLTKLQFLTLGGQVTGPGLAHLKPLANLRRLVLTGSKYLPSFWKQVAELTQLRRLDLNHTNVADADLAQLKTMTTLEWLDIHSTGIGDAGLAHLEALTTLKKLGIDKTKITPAGLDKLRKALPECKTYP